MITKISVLDKYIENLDKHLEVLATKEPGNVAKKVRKVGEPSKSIPPLDTPAWTIRKTSHATPEGIHLFKHALALLEIVDVFSEPLRDVTNSRLQHVH